MRTKEELKGMAQGIYWNVEHGDFNKAVDVLDDLQRSSSPKEAIRIAQLEAAIKVAEARILFLESER